MLHPNPGSSLAGNPHRPQFHYTPPQNWMNDPNGLVYHNGTYHLFHQYNPEGNQWGHMSWYHATSPDLVHWTHEGVALPEENGEMIFSGSAVVDEQNMLGVEPGAAAPMVAIYTGHRAGAGRTSNQVQCLAYSVDGGATWTKYEGNPVLDHADPEFRDPNVFWHTPTQTWIMALALSEQRKIQFYESVDLVNWTLLSDFGPIGSTEGIWECPALFRVPVEGRDKATWVLSVDVGSGAVAGGSGSQYFVGTFDGTRFIPNDESLANAPLWADFGPDFYAAIPWNSMPTSDGRTLWLGWMNNWDYADQLPTSPWRGAQTVPRAVSLRPVNGRLQLVQQPVKELSRLRENHVRLTGTSLSNETSPLADSGIAGTTIELIADFLLGSASTVGVNVRVGAREQTVVGYDAQAQSVFVDRTHAAPPGGANHFLARHTAPASPRQNRVTLRILVDRSSVEVFANGGEQVLTHRVFPALGSDGVSVFATDGTAELVSLDAWRLRSIWSNR